VGLALDLEDYRPSVLLHCWLGHLTCKIVSEMTYNVSSGTLNPTIPYHLYLLYVKYCSCQSSHFSHCTAINVLTLWLCVTAAEIWCFLIFQDGGRCHLGFVKFRIFNGWARQLCRTASPCQISSKSLELRPRYVSYASLAWKCLFTPLFVFLGYISPEWYHSLSWPQKGPSLGWTTSCEP